MQAAENVIQALQYLLIIIHLIMKCIMFYGCSEEDIMKDFLIWANKLRNFDGSLATMGE